MRLVNHSGYDTGDLYRFCYRGCVALGVPRERLRTLVIVVLAAPQRSRGCATIAGADVVIVMAPPSYSRSSAGFVRRASRLLEHELGHHAGMEHRDMDERRLYSLGPVPAWARDLKIRYRGRAPNQLRAQRGLPPGPGISNYGGRRRRA